MWSRGIRSPSAMKNGGDITVKISTVCENYMGHYLYMTPAYYEEVYGETPDYNCIFYKTADRNTEEAERVGEEALKLPGALSVSYTTDLREQVDNMLGALDLVILVLIVSAGMLAFVVLYNLNNIAITERKRELATLKVLGFYNNEVTMYVYREKHRAYHARSRVRRTYGMDPPSVYHRNRRDRIRHVRKEYRSQQFCIRIPSHSTVLVHCKRSDVF